MLKKAVSFPTSEISFIPVGSNSEMIREIEQRCGRKVFISPILDCANNLKECISKGVFPEGYFNDFQKEQVFVKSVRPREVGIIDDETFYQFMIRMKSEYDLKPLPASAFLSLCINFNPLLYERPTILTKIHKICLDGNFVITSVFVITIGDNYAPEVRWLQFNVNQQLNTDYNYLFWL